MAIQPETVDDDTDVYHVVCHDCETELLFGEQSEARQVLSEHESETEHSVEFAPLGD